MIGSIVIRKLSFPCIIGSVIILFLVSCTLLSAQSTPAETFPITPTFLSSPLPTMDSIEALKYVQNLFLTNGGCRLPCWWGVEPGKTGGNEAKRFLTTFIKRIGQGESLTITEGGETYFTTNYSAYFDVNNHEEEGRIIFDLKNEIVAVITVDPVGTELAYALPKLLTAYGKPKDVYILTYQHAPFPFIPFSLVLFYQDQGILAYYELEAQRNGEDVEACSL